MTFFPPARSELGGPSVAVRGGVQLGGVAASPMSKKERSKAVPPAALTGNLGGGATTLPFYLDSEKVTFAEMAVRPQEDQ